MASRSAMGSLFCAVAMAAASVAEGQTTYPRVYGPTGSLYGPTQAYYQYERQYGRPWHGYRGLVGGQATTQTFVVPAPYLSWPYSGTWGLPFAPLVAPAPGLTIYGPATYGVFGIYGTPGFYVPTPDHDLARQGIPLATPLADAQREADRRWGRDAPDVPPDPVTRPVPPSSVEARLKSLQSQSRGDEHLRKQEWMAAYKDYKKAVEDADDQAEAHLRLGVLLITLQHFDSAALSLKRAVHLDPNLPATAPSLIQLFGPDSALVRSSIAHKLVNYVEADIRDPDRLFLLGVMLHLDRDPRAAEVLETGLRLAGRGKHFTAFLEAPDAVDPAGDQAGSAPHQPGTLPLPPAPLPDAGPPSLPRFD